MNDMTHPTSEATSIVPASTTQAAAAVLGTMPTALALYLNDTLYDRVSAVAARMGKADGITPKHLIGKPEACFAVVSRAITWRLDPFAVAMATYQTPGGMVGFEGKLVHAIIENSGQLATGGIRYEHYGDWSKVQGKFKIVESQKTDGDGKAKKYAMATWTDDDARAGKPPDQSKYPFAASCGVRVSALLRGEDQPRYLDFDLIQAQPRNSTLWATDPMTQICYTAVRRFASSVVPSLIMGVPFDPQDNVDYGGGPSIDVTPTREDSFMPAAKATSEPEAVQQQQAASETKSKPAAEQQHTETQDKPAEQDSKPAAGEHADAPEQKQQGDAGTGKVASAAQISMLKKMASNKGLSDERLDELLVEGVGFTLASLPIMCVNKASQIVAAQKVQAA